MIIKGDGTCFYPVEDVAKKLAVNPETVRRWIRVGKITPIEENAAKKKGYFISNEEIARFRKEHFVRGRYSRKKKVSKIDDSRSKEVTDDIMMEINGYLSDELLRHAIVNRTYKINNHLYRIQIKIVDVTDTKEDSDEEVKCAT